MAISVRSTSPLLATTTGSPMAFPKPSGMALGDLMLCVLLTGDAADSIGNPTGFTNTFSAVLGDGYRHMAYKYAEASDVAASVFNFTSTGTGYKAGVLYAIPGATGAPTQNVTFSPVSQVTLAILTGFGVDNDNDVTEFSGYSLNGVATTVFTEVIDTSSNLLGAIDISFGSAHGLYESTSNITAFNITESGNPDTSLLHALFINQQENATGTNTLVTTTSEAFSQTGKADTNGSNILAEATGEAFTQSGRGESPTQWTNETKPSTTWTNESL
jgi:hypothetical protein